MISLFLMMFENFVVRCVAILSTMEAFTGNPDIVEDLFILAERILYKAPDAALALSSFDTLLQMAVEGLLLQHWDANSAVMRFLDTLLRIAAEKSSALPAVAVAAIDRIAVRLSATVVSACAGGLPAEKVCSTRDRPESLASILASISQYYGTKRFEECMRAAFAQPIIGPHVNPSLREKYVEDIVDASTYVKASHYDFEDVLYDISFASRKRQQRR